MTGAFCPACGFELDFETDGGSGLVVTFDMIKWKARCTSLDCDSPAQCVQMGGKVLALLLDPSKKPSGGKFAAPGRARMSRSDTPGVKSK